MTVRQKSRHQRHMDFMTKDPNGPHAKRLDVILPSEDYEMFRDIMDTTNMRRREALQEMIRARHEQLMAERNPSASAPALRHGAKGRTAATRHNS